MEDKKTDVKPLVEFKKAVVEFGNKINGFVEELSELLNDIEIPDEEEDTWEMKCPYNTGDNYWIICDSGEFERVIWNDHNLDKEVFSAGNAFPTKEAAELEAKRRNLLTRFRAFRDECNGDWKSDWDINKEKYFLYFSVNYGIFCSGVNRYCYRFNLFGYFKNKADCERAIELFGEEIKELFVDCEG